ncbi:hypothetical protein Trydic_g17817 [Trypoxylus dichotomus]
MFKETSLVEYVGSIIAQEAAAAPGGTRTSQEEDGTYQRREGGTGEGEEERRGSAGKSPTESAMVAWRERATRRVYYLFVFHGFLRFKSARDRSDFGTVSRRRTRGKGAPGEISE